MPNKKNRISFGVPVAQDITYRLKEASEMLTTIIETQPKDSNTSVPWKMAGGGGFDLGKRWENGHQKPSKNMENFGKIWKKYAKYLGKSWEYDV